MKTTHKPYFDLMRILAIFFVIFNHTGRYGFSLYTGEPLGSPKYWFYVVISVFCTFAVPLFFMISGALVLPKATVPDVWKKRIPKQALILVFFSLAYFLLAVWEGDLTKYASMNSTLAQTLDGIPSGGVLTEQALETPGVGSFLTVLYAGTWNFSFWFLYAYLAFLVSAPLLRTLAENLTNNQYYYLFGLYLAFKAGLPIFNWLVFKGAYTLNSHATLTWLLPDIVVYPLAGYFLEHRFSLKTLRDNKWLLPVLWGGVVLCLALAGALTWRKALLTGTFTEATSQTFHRIFNLVLAGTIYLTIKNAFYTEDGTLKEGNKQARALLASAGACTFGIYLLHVAVLKADVLTDFCIKLHTTYGLPKLGISLLQDLFVLLLCWAVTALWKGGVKLVQNLRQKA